MFFASHVFVSFHHSLFYTTMFYHQPPSCIRSHCCYQYGFLSILTPHIAINMWCDLGKPVTCQSHRVIKAINNSNVFLYFDSVWTSVTFDTAVSQNIQVKSSEKKIIQTFMWYQINSKYNICIMWRVFSDHITYEPHITTSHQIDHHQYIIQHPSNWIPLLPPLNKIQTKMDPNPCHHNQYGSYPCHQILIYSCNQYGSNPCHQYWSLHCHQYGSYP